MPQIAHFTAAEAAFVLREPVRAVKKALDAGPVKSTLLRRGAGAVRAIDWSDLFFLFALRSLRDELTPKAREEFYEAVKRSVIESERSVQFGRITISVGDWVQELQKRIDRLADLSDEVEFRDDGEPLLKGRDIEVYRIAALFAEMSVEEILEDYPSLSREQVETARAYATAYPKSGRPYPSITVKRALRGAGFEALDAVFDDNVSEDDDASE